MDEKVLRGPILMKKTETPDFEKMPFTALVKFVDEEALRRLESESSKK